MVLAQWMARSRIFASCIDRGEKVLELGSGLGVSGILAAKLGGYVTLSDFVPHVLDNLKASVVLNAIQNRAVVRRLNWAEEAGVTGTCSNHGWYAGGDGVSGVGREDERQHKTLDEEEHFDVIIGSDICYEHDHPALLEGVLRRRLAQGGRIFFLYAVRFPTLHAQLLERLALFCRLLLPTSLVWTLYSCTLPLEIYHRAR